MKKNQHLLFNPEILESYVDEMRRTAPANLSRIAESLQGWVEYVKRGSSLSELALEQAFNQIFFIEILGYSQPPGHQGYFNFLPKTYALGGEGFPDFLLGRFKLTEGGNLEKDIRLAVGELKSPGADLDRIDPARMKSPVEQAFGYALRNGLHLRWVIVSNMQEIRLYHHTSIDHFEAWRIRDFTDGDKLTDGFWTFYYLLQRDCLLGWPEPSRLENLLRSSLSQRLKLTEDFYDYYRRIVHDTYLEMARHLPELAGTPKGRGDLVRASQLLIHRGLVTCYFSDHPAELLASRALDRVVESALTLPSLSQTRVYDAVKDFFACLDKGSPDHYPLPVYGYDGGLFKDHPIIDSIDLPDSLFTNAYQIGERRVDGIFGFRVFDFHADLNEHLLGRIFEESVGDMESIHEALETTMDPMDGLERRRSYGLFYTREGLASFLAERALEDILSEARAKTLSDSFGTANVGELAPDEEIEFLRRYLGKILDLRIVDLACGSGAFLVSCYRKLSREAQRVHSKLNTLREGQFRLEDFAEFESELLRKCIYGNDLMPEAVEISRLALWIASARRNMKLGGLEQNFSSADAIADLIPLPNTARDRHGFPQVDLVIGNPPWGGEVAESSREFVQELYPDLDVEHLDSYELFLLVALKYLKQGGRLAYVLPHTFLYPEHTTVRRFLLEGLLFERFHYLGADWFGPKIRMNTTVVQMQNRSPEPEARFSSMTLVDEDRRKAIRGEASLAQLEEAYSFPIPQDRCSRSGNLEPFRYVQDDEVMARMQSHSIPLGVVCKSDRGVELGKEGHIIQCPSCGSWDSPQRKKRGGGYMG
ncbi:MAG: class I SAM-dependent DNA methyltransferase, partial [Thermoplasmata archaeon]